MTTPNPTQPATLPLVRWYLAHGMPTRLAEAVLVCRYLETLLADVPPRDSGRIQPVFDYPIADLANDWRAVRWFDLWLDGSTGAVVGSLPPSDGEPVLTHEHLPIDVQTALLFGRWANLFR